MMSYALRYNLQHPSLRYHSSPHLHTIQDTIRVPSSPNQPPTMCIYFAIEIICPCPLGIRCGGLDLGARMHNGRECHIYTIIDTPSLIASVPCQLQQELHGENTEASSICDNFRTWQDVKTVVVAASRCPFCTDNCPLPNGVNHD